MKDFFESLKGNARTNLIGNYSAVVAIAIFYFFINVILSSISSSFIGNDITSEIIFYAAVVLTTIISTYVKLGIAGCAMKLTKIHRISFSDFMSILSKDRRLGSLANMISIYKLIYILPITIAADYIARSHNLPLSIAMLVITIFVNVYASIRVMPAYYLIHDLPEARPNVVLSMSLWLTRNSSTSSLILRFWFSFVPLFFMGILSAGIGLLYVYPYFIQCNALYYIKLAEDFSNSKY